MNFIDLFVYENGKLYWKVKPSNNVKAGARIGCLEPTTGYRKVKVKYTQTYEHRIVWELFNGPIPEDMEIDHINHIRDDNRIENLRLVNRRENTRNSSIRSDDTSGVVGVCFDKKRGKWYAQIVLNGTRLHLGRFSEKSEAIKARLEAEMKYGFHENHGINRPKRMIKGGVE